jgi:hypothetical protein
MTDPTASKEGVVLGQTPAGATLCADGHTGCCSWDQSAPTHQGLNVAENRPSGAVVDARGDAWVLNRAFGRQQSVTKIANSLADCIERNGIPGIQTSSDVNGDGIITTDCDGNSLPDDASTLCTNGRAHEFYGLDDECILFTTQYGAPNGEGWPLALVPNSGGPASSSDVWAGTLQDSGAGEPGTFYRIDGFTGKIVTQVPLTNLGAGAHPHSAVVDSYGILWATIEATGSLIYFDTRAANPADPKNQGIVTETLIGSGFYSLTLDGYRDSGGNLIQQIWIANVGNSGAYRYRPVRDGTFASLAKGTWSHIGFLGTGAAAQGIGIAVDNRSPTSYAWVALDGYAMPSTAGGGAIGKIPIDISDGEQSLAASTNVFPSNQGGTVGAGVAHDLDIWGVNQRSSSLTHFTVDSTGNVSTTASDTVTLDDNPTNGAVMKPLPSTYSNFTGFGHPNTISPRGTYDWTRSGCGPANTRWVAVSWNAETNPGVTAVTMRARASDSPSTLATAPFTQTYSSSPADLTKAPGPLLPNPSGYVDVEFVLTTTDAKQTPKLKSFDIVWECINPRR